jgi:hypothetical protein
MKFTNTVRAAILFATLLPACNEQSEPARTVSWYREHAAERTAVVERCSDDPGRRRKDPNCINARRAAALEDVGSFKNLPPLRLQPRDESATDR